MTQQGIDPQTLQALILANQASTSRPAFQYSGTPVYRGVSASGQVGGINSNGTPMAMPAGATATAAPIDYGTMFASIGSAIQKGAAEWGAAKIEEGKAQGLMDSQVPPGIPEGYQPVAPNFRPILQFQPGALVAATA